MLKRKLWTDSLREVYTDGGTPEMRKAAERCLQTDSGRLVALMLRDEGSEASKIHCGQMASVIRVGHAFQGCANAQA